MEIGMYNFNEGLVEYFFNQPKTEDMMCTNYAVFIAAVIATIAISYLLGSINSAILISKIFYHDDIRKHGSGNAGLTNTLRTYGKGAALGCLLGDIFKTLIAIFVAGVLLGFNYYRGISVGQFCYMAGLFAVLGHIFPIYYKFKGGKGVLVTASMALALSPLAFAILLLVFIGIVALTKYVSLGSVTVAILYPVVLHSYFSIAFGSPMLGIISLCTVLLAIIIVWCHRGNLERISNRTERKFSFHKNKDDEEK